MVAKFFDIEIFAANARTQRSNQGPDLVRSQHLVKTGSLYIQDFTSKRQDSLRLTVPALFGRTTGTVTLDDEEFGLCRIPFLAVCQFAGQARNIQRPFATGKLAGFPRCFAGSGSFHNLANNRFTGCRMLFKPGGECLVHTAFDDRAHFRRNEFVLRLA